MIVDAPSVPPLVYHPRASQDASIFNIEAIIREINKSGARMRGQVILDKVFHTPFGRLHCLKGKFNSHCDLINEGEGDATPLKNKVKGLL